MRFDSAAMAPFAKKASQEFVLTLEFRKNIFSG